MLSMQRKEKVRKNIKSGREDSISSSNMDLLKGISSRICSKYDKVIEDGPTSKRILYRSKDHRASDHKSIASSVSRSPIDYLGNSRMSGEMRLASGFHNPCVINIMSQFDCKSKTIPSVVMSENVIRPTVIQIHLSESSTNPLLQRHLKCLYMSEKKRPRKMTRGTQTLYRESSMQTLPYLPDVSNDKETLKTLEIYKLPKILKGDGPPGLWEVEILERARKRWALEKTLNESFKCAMNAARKDIMRKKKIPEHRTILEAFEWENWLEREEHIQGCQMMRFQLVLHIFEKRQREMHKVSDIRIQKRCEQILQKRDHALKKNDIEFGREMRRLKIKHEKKPRNWRKEKISDQLGDPSSEYYAPQMRYGVNPNRRHFQLSRKAFEMRMEDLEKRAVNMKNLKCPFAKLKEWSKPKEQTTEVEQNFCSETNLQKLYEGLKGLREQSKRQKITPKCLVERTHKSNMSEVVYSEDYEIGDLDIVQDENSSIEMYEEEVQAGTSYSEDSLLEMYSQRNSQSFTVAEMLEERRREELENMLAEYEGSGIGWLMRFLSEEQSRLQEQRKLHFVTMLAQKERWRREAAEAGLRQKENEMRKIYEQIFEETERANADVCEEYLNNIFGIDTQEQADFKAISTITDLARIIDTDLQRWLTSFQLIQNPLNYDDLRCLLRDLVFPDNIAACLSQKYETQSIIDFIINDVLLERVYERLEPIDVAGSLTNEFVDRLFDTDLYIFSPECSSDCDCYDECTCQPSELESRAILRKLIRYSVPGRRWRTQNERIADENVKDIVDDICGAAETFKRCSFKSKPKKITRSIEKAPSVLNLLTSSNIENYEKINTSQDSSSENSVIDVVTVISYSKAKKKADSKKTNLVNDEKLLWEDTTTSSSELEMVEDLSFPESKSESGIDPLPLKPIVSTFDMSKPEIVLYKDRRYTSTDDDDQMLNRVTLDIPSTTEIGGISKSFLANIINEVVKGIGSAPPSEDDGEPPKPKEKKKISTAKSHISIQQKPPSETETSETTDNIQSSGTENETKTETEIERETEEKGFPDSHITNEPLEEELGSKVSEYEMVMYEAELKKILFDDEDECKCEMELEYQKSIRQLYESGKIKVIYRQEMTVEAETEPTEKDINITELTFEYATSVEYTIGHIPEEDLIEAEEFSQIIDEQLVTEAGEIEDNDDDKPKEIEATSDVPKDAENETDVVKEVTETEATVDVSQDLADVTGVTEEVKIETDAKEIEATADVEQGPGEVTGVAEEVAMEADANIDVTTDAPQNTGDIPQDTGDPDVVKEVAMETMEELPTVDETQPVASEVSPEELPEQNAQPPTEP